MTDAQAFYDLFVHRSDVFAQQHANGSYTPVRQPITLDDIEEHLAGLASYGVYVIDPGTQYENLELGEELRNTVQYIVFDLDVLDEEAADTLCLLVGRMRTTSPALMGLPPGCSLREFSGNKGTHVWLFFDEPVPAA